MGISIGDYPNTSVAHIDVSKNYSSIMMAGPPMGDELVSLVEHMYSEEEASLVRHIKPWRPKTAASIAKAAGRPRAEVKEIMQRLAHEKHVIFSLGQGDRARYFILPVVPGTFELVMMRKSADSVTPWHKRFAELFEALYDTGFLTAYGRRDVNFLRCVPVGEAIQAVPMALPSDRLEEIVEGFRHFGVGVCQCRLSKQLVGEGCGRMLETDILMGDFALKFIKEGRMREVSREEVLEIKGAAEKEGLITMIMVSDSSSLLPKGLCSCCGCCCAALRQISDFSAPGIIAPPHFIPRINHDLCKKCGKCAEACSMKAIVMMEEGEAKRCVHHRERCIGCGVCVVACRQGALALEELPDYRKPPANILSFLARHGPNFAIGGFKERSERARRGNAD